MEIKENVLLNELSFIFDENNQNYITDKKCINDETFLKVVAVEDGHALGYAVLYFGKDFLEKEDFPIRVKVDNKCAYIWNCVTKRGFESRGVQSYIFKYFTERFGDYDIYSVVDVLNKPSQRLHEKFGFEKIGYFEKVFVDELCKFDLLKCVQSKYGELK